MVDWLIGRLERMATANADISLEEAINFAAIPAICFAARELFALVRGDKYRRKLSSDQTELNSVNCPPLQWFTAIIFISISKNRNCMKKGCNNY